MALRKKTRQPAKQAKRRSGTPKYYRVVRAIAALKNANGSSLKSVQRYMRTSRKVTVGMMKRAIRARLVIRSRGRFKVSRLARRSKRGRSRRSRRRRSRKGGKRRKRSRRARRTRRRRRSRRSRSKKRRGGRRAARRTRRRRKVSRRRGRKARRRVSRRRRRRAAPRGNPMMKTA